MPDADTAIRVFNGLRRHLPLLEALGANSPYRHGRDTGLASARALTLRSWPRAGVPRAMADLDDFLDSTARLSHVAEVPDYTFHWWKLRPHPRIGTVEIRALDTQLSPRHTAALAAAVQSLALHESRARPVEGPPAEILDEASFRASRAGVEATLPDEDDRLRPVPELLERMVEAIRGAAARAGLRGAARRPRRAARRRRRRRDPAPRLPRRRARGPGRARHARRARRAAAQRRSVIVRH